MQYDFTFEEALKVLYNSEGWVQGERFNKNTFLSYDEKLDCFVLNAVDPNRDNVMDTNGENTLATWDSVRTVATDKYLAEQKYRFIGVLCSDAVLGIGSFENGWPKDQYEKVYRKSIKMKAFK